MTQGHLDIIQRSGNIFDTTLVGVGKNIDKNIFLVSPREYT
ncbi:MAG: hypothetical protein LBO09_00455 [Candidatus Peribacteria bacterium]|nr:hypothetical protein [Candidatus Peribacteria bacterium]